MSTSVESETDKMMFCASCGIGEADEIKLKKCTACYLVRYCGIKCQKDHWKQHKKECKKRAAELWDEILFKQPESNHFGDCPICCLPLSIDPLKSGLYSCCCKIICQGCNYANKKLEIGGKLQRKKCPFCREVVPQKEEEHIERLMKRIEANDPVALSQMGTKKLNDGDYTAAFEYWSKAVALGDTNAHYQLSTLYHHGQGVEKDENMERHHLTVAAIGGHSLARHNFGTLEGRNGQYNRAAKHFIIAAKLGRDESLKCVKELYRTGHVSKEDFAAALRGHNAAIEATKSPQREEAYEFNEFVVERNRRWN